MARVKPSVAGSVVAQVKARSEATGNLVSLAQAKLALTRLDSDVDRDTAKPFLRAVFPRPGGGDPYVYDLSFLLEFPSLTGPISAAFLDRCLNLRPRSRRGISSALSCGFFAFLRQERLQNLALGELTKPIFVAFIGWLNAPRANGHPLSPNTRALALLSLLTLDSGDFLAPPRR